MKQALNAADLLHAWERGLGMAPAQRAMNLLLTSGTPREQVVTMTIGQRDQRLLALREALFGPDVRAASRCPSCAEPVEISFQVANIQVAMPSVPDQFQVCSEGYEVVFRLPTAADTGALARQGSVALARQRLLERCVLSAARVGTVIPATELPDAVIEAINQRMAEADAQAQIELSLHCAACGHDWDMPFDIAAFLWAELNAWAQRMLREVHILARTYGWSERDILNMSAFRRQVYLQMAGQG